MSQFGGALARGKISSLRSFLLVLVAASAAASCTVRLIGDYDAMIDQGVSDLQQHAEVYFARLQSKPDTPYDSTVYDDLNGRLAVLSSRANSLPKYSTIAKELDNLKKQVALLQKMDSTSARPFPKMAVADTEVFMTVAVESILKLELALRRGDNPAEPTQPATAALATRSIAATTTPATTTASK